MAHLSVRDLRVRYGSTEILRGVSFDVRPGQIVALLGANGSGKSTALNAVSGFVRPHSGSVRLDSEEVAGLATHQIFRKGISQISQARDLFPEMSVQENLELGMANCADGLDKSKELSRIFKWFPRLSEKRGYRAQALSGGEQQMIAIGRALIRNPKVLLLDEPSGGLAPKIVEEIAEIIMRLKKLGHTMLIVEQNIPLAKYIADTFLILKRGEVINGNDVVNSSKTTQDIVRQVYL